MRKHLRSICLVSALALIGAAPAFAQQSASGQTWQQAAAQGGAGQYQGQLQGRQHMSADQLRQMLEQAGLRDISIVDSSYIVQARTRDGHLVTLRIDPPVMEAFVEESGGPRGSSRQGYGYGGQQGQSGLTEQSQGYGEQGYSQGQASSGQSQTGQSGGGFSR